MYIKLGRMMNKHYKLVLVFCLIFTGICVWGITKLKIQTQMFEQFPQNHPEMQAYKYALDNFKGMDSIIVVLEGKREKIIRFINDHAAAIKKVPGVDDVIFQSEIGFLEKNSLLLVGDRDDMDKMKGMLTASSLKDFIKGLNDNLEAEYTGSGDSEKVSDDQQEVLSMLTTINNFAQLFMKKSIDRAKILDLSDEFIRGQRYFISHDGKVGIMLVRTSVNVADMENSIPMVNGIEKILFAEQDKYGLKGTLTGMIVLQRDEMYYTEKDMQLTSILSLVLILIIFYAGFKALRYSILAGLPLIVGIIWALGMTSFLVGSLSIFTAMMVAILIGLGIDYAIHVISIFTEIRLSGAAVEESIAAIFEKSAPGIVTGAVTTALGFFIFILSSFGAFAEFGLVLGLGISLTLLASLSLLPALLIIFHAKKRVEVNNRIGEALSHFEKVIMHRPLAIMIIMLLVVVLAVAAFPRVHFTNNMLEVEPVGLPSVEINKLLEEKFNFTSDTALVVSKSLEDSAKVKEKTDDLSSIGFVDSINQYIPAKNDQIERLKKLREIKQKLQGRVSLQLFPGQLKAELLRLEDNIIELSDLAYMGGEKELVRKCDSLVESKIFSQAAEAASKNQNIIKETQNIFISNLNRKVAAQNDKNLITIADLPANVVNNYRNQKGEFLTIIYPKGDVWNRDFQEIFIKQFESMNEPRSTGMAQLTLMLITIAGTEGKRILMLTVVFIYLILLFDFRSIKYATFAMLPMFMSLALVLGIMGWFNIPFNFVNIIALPMIIGIGVDDGVHLIHRYRIEKKLSPAIKSTGRAITLSTITTMAAFGTLMLAKYRGFASFALLLTMGIGLAYIVTILLLPALITVFDKPGDNNV
ncbi:RND family transporter [Candidatus Margulisiibacteriota bacterium]